MTDEMEIEKELRRLAGGLPKGSKFTFFADADLFRFDVLDIPRKSRGIGTEFLATVLAVLDRHELPSKLTADSTDDPCDPCDYDLAKWYARFGFEPVGLTVIGTLEMRREARACRNGVLSIMADYAAAKAAGDVSREAFDEWRNSSVGTSGTAY